MTEQTSRGGPPALPPVVGPGDRVAVLSPSWCAPAHFPAVHEQAMARIRDLLQLEPVEFPTTRVQGSPAERARDVMAAFADPSIRAVMATIGGDDQVALIRHLDPEVVRADPKPFFGYSDNTNPLNWLWKQGIAGFHGGSTQVHLGPGASPAAVHLESLRAALFGGGDLAITPLPASADVGLSWDDPRVLTDQEPLEPTPDGWFWSGPRTSVRGCSWGGNLEVLQWVLGAGHAVGDVAAYEGCVLLLETSEERPGAGDVVRMLRVLGERGVLERVAAVLVARPQASQHHDDPGASGRAQYRLEQRAAMCSMLHRYAAHAPVVVGVEFGHTRPQWVLPYGGELTVDAVGRRVIAHFGGSDRA